MAKLPKIEEDLIIEMAENLDMTQERYPAPEAHLHERGDNCWCNPQVVYEDPDNGNVVYDHRWLN